MATRSLSRPAHVLGLLLYFCCALPAYAVSTLTLSPAGDGVFALQGVGIEDASALEIVITYDSSTIVSPRVIEGPLISGAMMAINPNVPGTIRIVAIRIAPVRGSGLIATLAFSRTGSSPGRITALTAKLANATGLPLLAQVQVLNPSETNAAASASTQGESTPSAAGSGNSFIATAPTVIIVGQPNKPEAGVNLPEEQASKDREIPSQDHGVSPDALNDKPEPVKTAMKTEGGDNGRAANTRQIRIYAQKSVLDRFREYKGERTAETLLALFDQESFIGFRQAPIVAVSDGASTVTVTFIAPPGNLSVSDLSVEGAKLLGLIRDPDNSNTWIARLLPVRGTYAANLAVLQGDLKMMYPLTITPKAAIHTGKSDTVTKADINRYLTMQKKAAPQKADLNNDGQWDYRDDYILSAAYFRSLEKRPKK